MIRIVPSQSEFSRLLALLRGTTALVAMVMLDGALPAHAAQVVTQITPDGRTQTIVTPDSGAKTVTTGTMSGGDAFNSFKNFTVGTGATVNLIVPGQANSLINVVRDSAVDVEGTLNSFKNGRIGGNVYFADPYGMVVGAQGAVNVGALTVTTPTAAFLDKVVSALGKVDAGAVTAIKAGDEPVSKDGLISIKGAINAKASVRLRGYQVASTGTIEAKLAAKQLFDASVNTKGLKEGTDLVESADGIEIVAATDAEIGGSMSVDGAAGRNAGNIQVTAGHDIAIDAGTRLSASGHGVNSGGGGITVKATNNLVVGNGVQLSTHAGGTGDAGNVELSADESIAVGQVTYDLSATAGKAGTVSFDPPDLTISGLQITNGGNYCVGDCATGTQQGPYGTVTLAAGANIDTVGMAGAASGNIAITGQNIVVAGTTVASGITTAGAILNAAASTGGKAGSIILTAAQSQTPSSSIDAAGSSDTITVGKGAVVTGGAVTLAANATMLSGEGTADAAATINVAGAITGSSVSIVATSDAETTGLASLTALTGAAANDITSELGLNASTLGLPIPLDGIGYMHAGAASSVTLLNGANVSATDAAGTGVTIQSLATEATSNTNQPSIGLATTVSEITGAASTLIGYDATISSASNIEIASHDLAIGSPTATTSSSNAPVALTLDINEANITTTAIIATGAAVNAAGQISLIARNDDAFATNASATAGGTSAVGSGAVGLAFIDTSATAIEGASIGQNSSVPANLLVEADTIGVSDTVDAASVTGGSASSPSPTGNQETGDYVENDYIEKYLGTLFTDAGNTAQVSGVVAYNNVTHDTSAVIEGYVDPTSGDGAPATAQAPKVTASQGVAVLATAWDGGLESNANSSNSANSGSVDSKDTGTSASNPKASSGSGSGSGGTGFAVDAAVAITNVTNNTSALVAPQASVTAPDVAVAANFTLPVDNGILTDEQTGIGAVTDSKTVITDLPGSLSLSGAEQTATDGWTVKGDLTSLKGIYDDFSGQIGLSNGFAAASGSASTGGVYGSIDYVELSDNTAAWVGAGAHISSTGGGSNWTVQVDGGDTSLDPFQSSAYQTTYGAFDPASASPTATFAVPMAVTVAANSSTIFIDTILSQPGSGDASVGGSANIVTAGGNTVAGIDAGAVVDSDSGVSVEATTTDLGLIVTASSGSGAGVGITGDVSFLDLSNATHAVVSENAQVSAPSVDVAAAQNMEIFNVAGDLTQSTDAAIGASVAIGLSGTTTDAYVGDATADRAIVAGMDSAAATSQAFNAAGYIDTNALSVTATTSGTDGTLAIAGSEQKGSAPSNGSGSGSGGSGSGGDSDTSSQGDSTSFFSGLSSEISSIQGPVTDLLSGNADGLIADLADKATSSSGGAQDSSGGGTPAPTSASDADSDTSPTPSTGATGSQSFGLAVSGSGTVTLNTLDTEAWLQGATVSQYLGTGGVGVSVGATRATSLFSLSGAAALSLAGTQQSTTSAAIAGAVAYDDSANITGADLAGSNIQHANALTVEALSGGFTVDIGLSLAADTNGGNSAAVAASATIVRSDDASDASVIGSAVTGNKSGAVEIAGYDNELIGMGGGSFYGGKGVGAGAGVNLALIGDPSGTDAISQLAYDAVAARVENSTIQDFGTVDISANDPMRILSAAVQGGYGADGSLSIGAVYSEIYRTVKAEIASGSTIKVSGSETTCSDGVANCGIDVTAGDNGNAALTAQIGTAGAAQSLVDFGAAGLPQVLSIGPDGAAILEVGGQVAIGGVAAGIGFSGAYIHDDVTANVSDSSLTSTGALGNVVVSTSDTAEMAIISAGIAISTTDGFSFIGSGTANIVDGTLAAEVGASGVTTTIDAPGLTVNANDSSTIRSLAGNFTLTFPSGEDGIAAAVGAAVDYNQDSRKTKAGVTDATLGTLSRLTVDGSENGTIQTIAVSGAVAAGIGPGLDLSVALNDIGNTASATIGGKTTLDNSSALINVDASNESLIQSLSGSLSASGGDAAGAAISLNAIGDTTTAGIDGDAGKNDLSLTAGDVTVSAVTQATIDTIAVGLAASGNAGAGSIATNLISGSTSSGIGDGSTVIANNNVVVEAGDADSVQVAAGAAGIGVGGTGAGLAVEVNDIGSTTSATIGDDTSTRTSVTALGKGDAATVANGQPSSALDASTMFDLSGNSTSNTSTYLADMVGAHPSGNDPESELKLLGEGTKTIHGIAVNAASSENVGDISAAIGVSTGESAAIALNAAVDLMGGTTTAAIDKAVIDGSITGAGSANVDVTASSLIFAANFVAGAAAGGDVGAAGAAGVTVFNRATTASITNSNIGVGGAAAGAVTVSANSEQNTVGLVAGVALSGAGLAGSGIVNTFDATTTGSLSGGTADAQSMNVGATDFDAAGNLAGAGALGGAAGAAAFYVATVEDSTDAYIGDQPDEQAHTTQTATSVDIQNSVTVAASSTEHLSDLTVSGAGAGGLAVAGLASVDVLESNVQSGLYDTTLGYGSQQSQSLSVAADNTYVIDPTAGALGIGIGGAGVGAAASVVIIKSNDTAELIGDTVAAKDVTVEATTTKAVDAIAVSLGAGLDGGLSGAVSVVIMGPGGTSDSQTNLSGDVGGSGSGTLGAVDSFSASHFTGNDTSLDSTQQSQIDGDAVQSSGTALTAPTVDGTTARIVGGTITADDSVSVEATDSTSTNQTIGGAAVGGLLGFGASVGFDRLNDDVSATISGATVTTRTLTLSATASDAPNSNGYGNEINAYDGSGGFVAISASIADAVIANNVTAGFGGTDIGSNGNTGISAIDSTSMLMNAGDPCAQAGSSCAAPGNVSIGVLAAGASVAYASKTSTVSATTADQSSLTGLGQLSLTASDWGKVYADAIAAAGGLGLAANGSDANAADSATVTATIGLTAAPTGVALGTTLRVTGGTFVSATDTPDLQAQSFGLSVAGGIGIGASVSTAEANPTVLASLGDSVTFNAGSGALTVHATLAQGSDPTANAESTAAAGGILAGANATVASAIDSSNVTAALGDSITLPASSVDVEATTTDNETANATGLAVGGLLAIGAESATTDAASNTAASIGAGTGGSIGSLTLKATDTDQVTPDSTAGSGGIVAGAASLATGTDQANTTVTMGNLSVADSAANAVIGDGAINAGAIGIDASHTFDFHGTADSTQAAVAGASGAVSSITESPLSATTVTLGSNVDLTGTTIDIEASNDGHELNLLGPNAKGAGGGVITGNAVESDVTLNGAATVTLGGLLATSGDPLRNPGAITINAYDNVDASDDATLSVGGAIELPYAASNMTVNETNTVELQATAELESVGTLGIGAYGVNSAQTEADVSVSGAAGAGGGKTSTTVNATNNITLDSGSQALAFGDIDIAAGQSADGAASNAVTANATTTVFNWTVVPITTTLDATASATGANTLTIASGAMVAGVQNVRIGAYDGIVNSDGSATGHNPYLAIVGTDQTGGSGEGGTSTATIQLNGTVLAGVDHDQEVTFDGSTLKLTSSATSALGLSSDAVNFFDDVGGSLAPNPISSTFAQDEANLTAILNTINPTTDPTDFQSLTQEIALLNQISSDVPQDTTNPVTGQVIDAVTALTINDLLASGGNITISADTLKSTGGVLQTWGVPVISIRNSSSDYLLLNQVDDSAAGTGQILFEGAAKIALASAVDNVATTSADGLTATQTLQGTSSLYTGNEPVVSTIDIENTLDAQSPDATSVLNAPAIYLQGEINNSNGNTTIVNESGDVAVFASINSKQLTLLVPNGSLFVNDPSTIYYPSLPQSAWAGVVDGTLPNGVNDVIARAVSVLFNPNNDVTTQSAVLTGDMVNEGFSASTYADGQPVTSNTNGTSSQTSYIFYPSSNGSGSFTINDYTGVSCGSGGRCDADNGGQGTTNIDFNSKDRVYQNLDGGQYIYFGPNGQSKDSQAACDFGADCTVHYLSFPLIGVVEQPLVTTATIASSSTSGAAASTVLAGGSIGIFAKYIDIDAAIEAGHYNDWSVYIPASITSQINQDNNLYANPTPADPRTQYYALSGISVINPPTNPNNPNTGDSLIDASWDAVNQQIVLDDVNASGGGSVTLFGGIISTDAQGSITVNNGFGQVAVNNQSSLPLVIQNINTGTGTAGTVEITDTLQPTFANGLYQTHWYVNTVGSNSISIYDNSNGATTLTGAHLEPTPVAGNTVDYQPLAGTRYQWTETYEAQQTLTIPNENYDGNGDFKTSGWSLVNGENVNGTQEPYSSVVSVTTGNPTSEAYYQQNVSATAQYEDVNVDYNNGHGEYGMPGSWDYKIASDVTLTYTNSIKADNPFAITFNNNATPSVDIQSVGNVIVSGKVYDPLGNTTISVSGPTGTLTTSGAGSISGNVYMLTAPGGVGTPGNPLNIAASDAATALKGDAIGESVLNCGIGGCVDPLTITSTGTNGIYVSSDAGIIIGTITSGGDVTLTAVGNITTPVPSNPSAQAATAVTGQTVTLTSTGGTIGNNDVDDAYIVVSAQMLNANAAQDVSISAANGNLTVGQVISGTGSVSLTANGGQVIGASLSQAQQAALQNQATTAAQNLGLIGLDANGISAAAESALSGYDRQVETDYAQYWQIENYLGASPSKFAAEVTALTGNATPSTSQIDSEMQLVLAKDKAFLGGAPGVTTAELTAQSSSFTYDLSSLDKTTPTSAPITSGAPDAQALYTELTTGSSWNSVPFNVSTVAPVRTVSAANGAVNIVNCTTCTIAGNGLTAPVTFTATVDLAANSWVVTNPPTGFTSDGLKNDVASAAPGTLIVDSQSGNTVTYTLLPTDTVSVASLAPISITAAHDYVIDATGTVSLANTVVGGTLTIITTGDVVNAAGVTAANPAATVGALDIVAQGNIGQASSPLYVDVQQNYIPTLSAGGFINFVDTNGDLVLGNVTATGNSQISAPHGNISSYFPNTPAGYTGAAQPGGDTVNIVGSLTLQAHGSIGTHNQPFVVDQIAGTLSLQPGQGVDIDAPTGSLALGSSTVPQTLVINADSGDLSLSGTIGVTQQATLTASGAVNFAGGTVLTGTDTVGITGGNINMGGDAQVTAGRQLTLVSTSGDIVLGQASSADGSANAVTVNSAGGIYGNGDGQVNLIATAANGGVSLRAANGIGGTSGPLSLTAPYLQASSTAGDIVLTATGDTDATHIAASGGMVNLTGDQNLTFGAVTAQGDAALLATGDLTGTTLTSTGGAVMATADDSLNIGSTTAAGNIGLTAINTLTAGDVTSSNGTVTLNGTDIVTTGTVFAAGNVAAAATNDLTSNVVTSVNGTVRLTGLDVTTTGAVGGNGDVTIAATDTLNTTSVTSTASTVELSGTDIISIGAVSGNGNVSVQASDDVTAAAVASTNGALLIHGANDLSVTTARGQTATLTGGSSVDAGTVTATAGDALVTGTGAVTTGTVLASGNVTIDGQSIAATVTTASTGNVTLAATTGDITGTSVEGYGNVTLSTGGSIDMQTITAKNGLVSLQATNGGISVAQLSGAGDLDFGSGGSLSFQTISSSAGNLNIGAGQDISIGSGSAQGSIDLTAKGSIDTGALTASTGNADLTAGGGIAAGTTASTGGGIDFSAGQSLSSGTANALDSISLTAANITSGSATSMIGDLTFNAGQAINSGDTAAYHNISFTAGDAVSSASAFALTGDAVFHAPLVIAGSMTTNGNTDLQAATQGTVDEAGFVSSPGIGSILANAIAMGLSTVQTAGSVYIDAPGAFTSNSVVSRTGGVFVNAGSVTAGQIASTIGDVSVMARGDIDAMSVSSLQSTYLTALGSIDVAQIATLNGGAHLQARGNITVQHLTTPAATLTAPGNVLVELGLVSNFFTVDAGNIAANLTEPSGGAGMLVMDLTGYRGGMTGTLDLNVSNAQSIMFPVLQARQAALNLSAPFVTIASGEIGTDMSLRTGQMSIMMDNASAAPQDGYDVQYFGPGKVFTLQVANLRSTSSAFAIDYATGITIHLPGEDAEDSASLAPARAAYDSVHGQDLATGGPETIGAMMSYTPLPAPRLVSWSEDVTPVNMTALNSGR